MNTRKYKTVFVFVLVLVLVALSLLIVSQSNVVLAQENIDPEIIWLSKMAAWAIPNELISPEEGQEFINMIDLDIQAYTEEVEFLKETFGQKYPFSFEEDGVNTFEKVFFCVLRYKNTDVLDIIHDSYDFYNQRISDALLLMQWTGSCDDARLRNLVVQMIYELDDSQSLFKVVQDYLDVNENTFENEIDLTAFSLDPNETISPPIFWGLRLIAQNMDDQERIHFAQEIFEHTNITGPYSILHSNLIK